MLRRVHRDRSCGLEGHLNIERLARFYEDVPGMDVVGVLRGRGGLHAAYDGYDYDLGPNMWNRKGMGIWPAGRCLALPLRARSTHSHKDRAGTAKRCALEAGGGIDGSSVSMERMISTPHGTIPTSTGSRPTMT